MAQRIAALIRHGDYHQRPDTPSAHQPYPLTSEGEDQALEAAVWLYDELAANGWGVTTEIDSSQLLRGWQTARIIAERLTERLPPVFEVTPHAALAERGVGSAANLTLSEIEQVLEEDPRFPPPPEGWKSNSHYRLPLQGAESLMDAGRRVADHLESRMKQAAGGGGTLKLFVGHGAAFRHAAYHIGVLRFEQIAQLSMYHARPILLEYLPNGQWRHIGGEWKIRKAQDEYTD
ncbi:MAG: histidine phosphatase family protein [Sedimenticola sp.]